MAGITAAQEAQLREVARVDNMEQIDARRQATKDKRINMRDYTQEVGFTPLPAALRDAQHTVVLLAVTGPGYTRPACPYTGVCLMAAFSDDTDGTDAARTATAFAKRRIAPAFDGADIRAVPLDRWFLIAATPERMADEAYCMAAMQANMDRYYAQLRANQRHFVAKVEDVTDTREHQLALARKEAADLEADLAAAIRDAAADAAEIARLEAQLQAMRASRADGAKKNAKRKHKRALEELRAAAEPDAAEVRRHEAALEDLDTAVKASQEEIAAVAMMADTLRAKNPEALRARLAAAQARADALAAELDEPETRRRLLERKAEAKRKAAEAARMAKAALQARTGAEQLDLMGTAAKEPGLKSARAAMQRSLVRQACRGREALLPFPQEVIPRSQRVANVCWLEDTSKEARAGRRDAEPMMRVLRLYDSAEAAKKDAEENLSRYIGDFDIQAVDVGEWLFPDDVDYDQQEDFKYRDAEQNRIMQSRKREKKKVRNYEQLCAEAGVAVDEVFVREAEEGLSADDYYRQMQIQGSVAEARRAASLPAADDAAQQ